MKTLKQPAKSKRGGEAEGMEELPESLYARFKFLPLDSAGQAL